MAGMFLGVFFDFYRVVRGKILKKKGRRQKGGFGFDFFGDLVFWGMTFVLITPIIYWGTWLELRLYVWLIILAGIGIYWFVFSPVIIPWLLGLWRIITWLPRKLGMALWRFKAFSKKVSLWLSK